MIMRNGCLWSGIGLLFVSGTIGFLSGCKHSPKLSVEGDPNLPFAAERRLENIRQLTFEGNNAEAYWSYDGKYLTYQYSSDKAGCDQIYRISIDGKVKNSVSNGKGRSTCSFFTPDSNTIIYSSTHLKSESCPEKPDMSNGYVWPVYSSYQFFKAPAEGLKHSKGSKRIADPIPAEPGAPSAYNAELTTCGNGKVVFTSTRHGDLELYTGELDNDKFIKQIKRITFIPGYDGGAVFSRDCSKIAWRAFHPKSEKEKDAYQDLLAKGEVKPSKLELWVAEADGSKAHQVTFLNSASFAPTFTPDGNHLVFSSNYKGRTERNFDLFMVNLNGTALEKITYSDTFDSFPMFSPDGKHLAFSSNRHSRNPGDTNIFIADWNPFAPGELVTEQDPLGVNRAYAITKELSSPDMEGRGVGTEGLVRAENYLADLMEKYGVKPLKETYEITKDIVDYSQPVKILTSVDVDFEKSKLQADWRVLAGKNEFSPSSFSGEQEFEGNLIETGYGIVAPEMGLDDYQNKKVKNKVVLIRRNLPTGIRLSAAQITSYRDDRYKTFLAKSRGAAAVLFWDPEGKENPETGMENLRASIKDSDVNYSSTMGIPVFYVSKKIAQEWLKAKASPKISGRAALKRKESESSNLIGYVGADCKTQLQPVLIGAHYDHLGMRSSSSLESFQRGLHSGADDNASGVAAVLNTAHVLKDEPGCYWIALFTAEEIGVIGSTAFAAWMKSVSVKPRAMLNFDMVGRMLDNKLHVFGAESAGQWNSILLPLCEKAGLDCNPQGDGYGPSDHMPFYLDKIPVLHFFTGVHVDYHRSTDTIDKINATGIEQVSFLATELSKTLSKRKSPLRYVGPKGQNTLAALQSQSLTAQSGIEAYFGTIPDYSGAKGLGVLLSGVKDGSPAAEAGVREKDRIIRIKVLDSEPGYAASEPKVYEISGLTDYTMVLKLLKPGMRIQAQILRLEKTLWVNATLGQR